MKLSRLFHILRFLHFNVNRKVTDKTDEIYDRLWGMRNDAHKRNTKDQKWFGFRS
jgi:hypothetical protein